MTTTPVAPPPPDAAPALRLVDFDFDLPPCQIAQQPLPERPAARMLHLADGRHDCRVRDLTGLLRPEDLLIFNDTRVLPARLLGTRVGTGGRVEILIERLLEGHEALAQLRAARPLRPGTLVEVKGGFVTEVIGQANGFYRLRFPGPRSVIELLERHGRVPLPPYITRLPGPVDRARYQTLFARRTGAVAAPTAGLHFDEGLLASLDGRGIDRAFVTLHVGAGTFQPVRVADPSQHRMHAEWVDVPKETVEAIDSARRRGGRVIAVGTTVVRALETAAAGGGLAPYRGETSMFIMPGHRFRVIDLLLTNFHLPRSTLLMLVCAFGGRRRILDAYAHAVRAGYRFYSYGDCMLVQP